MGADVQIAASRNPLPIDNRLHRYTLSQPKQNVPDRVLGQQMTHPRLLGARPFKEQLKHRDYQGMAIVERDRTGRLVRRASSQPERQPLLTVSLEGREPQVVGMLKHRQSLAAIELHSELGTEIVKAFLLLHRGQNPIGKCTGIEQHLPIEPGGGAEHQIANIVTRRMARAQSCGKQAVDQGGLFVADATNLQVAAVGRLDHTTGISLGCIGHGDSLLCADGTTAEFDSANAAVQRLDDTQ